MKAALAVLLVVAIFAFGGTYVWMTDQKEQAEAQAADAQALADSRETVLVSFTVEPPEGTPTDQSVYISGSHPNLGAWEAAGLPLELGDDGKYHGQCEMLSGIEHEFKSTRGTWSTVERTAEDGDVPNRVFTVEKDQPQVVAVAAWVDRGETVPGRITTVGDIRLHERRFRSTVDPEKPRSVVVYLPPGYDAEENAETRYPVLYLNDGQNLFNELTTFAGVEWGLDEAAEAMIGSGQIEPVIIVGLYNTENRDDEYSLDGVAKYADHLMDDLKPFIDTTYRTKTDRANTTIGGAGLGGIAALETARLNPEAFGTIVAFSPWLETEDGGTLLAAWQDNAESTQAWLATTKVYLDTADSTAYYPTEDPAGQMEALGAFVTAAGGDATIQVLPDAEHRESSW